MNVLFITSNRLGDAVLSTGLLDYITRAYPESSITIVCGDLPSSLFVGVPCLKEIIVLKKQTYNKHWIGLWVDVVSTKWDVVVDLRDSAVSRLIRAKTRYIHSRHIDRKLHKVEQNAAVMKLIEVPAPRLWVSKGQQHKAVELVGDGGPVLAIGPTANWIGKTWPPKKFIELIRKLTGADGVMPFARVAVFAAPGEEEGAYKVLSSVPEDRQIDVIARVNPGEAATAIAKCDLYIGNDSGLMHCAAAAGVPTVGLFGPSYPHLYRPWGRHCTYVSTNQTFDELTDFLGYNPKTLDHSLMVSLSVDDVYESCLTLFNAVNK